MARTHHPHPDVLADHLEAVARHLRTGGTQAIEAARLLASRGYPSGGLVHEPIRWTNVDTVSDTFKRLE